MIRALKAAFFLRYPIAGLGAVPINLIGVACFGLLGFRHHGFWFAGAGLETAYLAALATNWRFQRWVNAQASFEESGDVEAKRLALLKQLAPPDRLAMARLSGRCDRIVSLWRAHDEVVVQSNLGALRDLQWVYLKLLLAKQHLLGSEGDADGRALANDIQALERELAEARLSTAARESKRATLDLLKRRAVNIVRRRQTLDEIGGDLARVEQQVALVLENTTLEGKPHAVSADLNLASQLLDGSYFGSSADDIAAVDAVYRVTHRERVSE